MPDRIEAGSYACAAAITGGSLELAGACADDMHAILAALRDAGVHVEELRDGIRVSAERRLRSLPISTAPFPALDRTSVGSGKSVSVRVDIGGRRIIKKQTTIIPQI